MSLSRFALVPLLALAASACHAHVYAEPEPYSVTAVTSAPYGVETAPYVTYEGHPTYWHSGRWWYRGNGGNWYYYHQEPPALYRQRPYVQQAPPAYRGAPGYNQPYYNNQPPASAPPATRVQ